MTTQLRKAQTAAQNDAPAAEPAIQVTGLTKIYGPRGGAASKSSGWFGGKKSAADCNSPRRRRST